MEINGEYQIESTVGIDAEEARNDVAEMAKNRTEVFNSTDAECQLRDVSITVESGVSSDARVNDRCVKKLRVQSPIDEVANDSKSEPSDQNHDHDVLYDCNLAFVGSVDEVKDEGNDDIFSEVSNPNPNQSSSQLHDVLINDQSGCGEITSARSRGSPVDLSLCEAAHDSNRETESFSCFVREIPEHVSTTGVRKITFKFRKREECDGGVGRSAVGPAGVVAPCYYSQFGSFDREGYVESPVEEERPIKRPRYNSFGSSWEVKKTPKDGAKKRDNDLHKLIFMPNGLPDGTDLAYYSKGKMIRRGYKHGNGIVCSCCDTEISPSQFEAHCGWAAKRQPYRHIYTSNGLTLHDIAMMLASGQSLDTSGSDDMCAECGGGGELILCNGCPRGFHAACLNLGSLPEDDWHCPSCIDKFVTGRKASGGSRRIFVRQTRVVKAPELEPGGCVFCRSQDFSAAKFDDQTMILCDQCEKEYHVGCLRKSGLCDLQELPKDKWFCCHDCSKIFSVLKNLTSSGPEVIEAPVSAVIRKKHATVGLSEESCDEIKWCILSGKSRFPEHLMLLSQAAAIFRGCFDPILAKTGRDLIPVMVYGRNIAGQEFSGMYCVVLIVKSVVVSAALLRIFGQEVAELPLVATCKENQGKGYFQALFSCIERLLLSINVKHLVLPAAEEAEPMWTKKLGFRKTSNEQMLKYMRDFQLTMFRRTSLLEKEIQQLTD